MLRFILFILLMAGVVLLEMYLAHKPGRWPGLVLPIVSFLISLIYPLSITNLGDMAAAIARRSSSGCWQTYPRPCSWPSTSPPAAGFAARASKTG